MPAASSLEPVDSALEPSVVRSSCTKQRLQSRPKAACALLDVSLAQPTWLS